MFRTGNPVLNESTFDSYYEEQFDRPAMMTVQGTVNKTAILLALVVIAGAYTWHLGAQAIAAQDFSPMTPWMIGGLIAGLVLALVTVFKPTIAAITAPLYAVAQGLFLGALSVLFETMYPGIVFSAIGCTFGVLAAMLLLYTTRIVQVTQRFRMGVLAATGGIMLFYLVAILLRVLGVRVELFHEMLWGGNWLGIGFSIFVIVIAALNLVLDFDLIERGAQQGAPKYMEWFGGFALLVTLIWLYIEFLRLLAKLRSR